MRCFDPMTSCLVRLALVCFAGPAGFATPAEPIRLNSIGYLRGSPKIATISAKDAGQFYVLDLSSGREVQRGKLSRRAPASDADQGLFIADLSALDKSGEYRIELADSKVSEEFHIGKDVYNWPFYCVTRGMYLWRCGTSVSTEFEGKQFEHSACHMDDGFLDYIGGPAGTRKDANGGWHDAGDYNKYTVNAAFTVGMMLQAWEQFHDKLAHLKLDIPESGNKVPDFLDEVRWELEWLLKMQADDGSVYHKLSTRKFGGFVLPEEEKERRYFSPWSSAATADFVAIMAQAARVFRPFDAPFSDACLAAAKKSNQFLQAHPEDHRPALSAFDTGAYDAPDSDDRLWAAAEMWETTGEDAYLQDLQRRVGGTEGAAKDSPTVDVDWDWGNLRNLGVFTFLQSSRPGRDAALLDRVRNAALRSADEIVKTARHDPYGRPLGKRYYWGCNGTVARQTMNLNIACRLSAKEVYRDTMLDALNHLFGRNPYGRSYVTGLGQRPPLFPHDRRSGGDSVQAPWPGYLVGGAWPKSTDWSDDQASYQTNEIAINWNGALIYALAAFVYPEEFERSIEVARKRAGGKPANER